MDDDNAEGLVRESSPGRLVGASLTKGGLVGEVIRRYPLISYFVIAYAGTWLVWALFVLSREGSLLLPFHSPASFLVAIGIGTFSGPTVGALVVTAVTEGREGVVRLLRRIVQWRVGLVWYLFAL